MYKNNRNIIAIGMIVMMMMVMVMSAPLASLSMTFGQTDQQQLAKVVSVQQGGNGLFNGELRDTFYAVGALTRMGQKVERADAVCGAVRNLVLEKRGDVIALFQGVSVLAELKCLATTHKITESDIGDTITRAIASGSLEETAAAVHVLFALVDAKLLDYDTTQLQQVAKQILALEDTDGTFRAKSGVAGSLSSTATAHFVLARLAHRLKDANIADRPVKKVLASATENTRDTLGFEDLATTATLLRGFTALSSAGGQTAGVEPSTIVRIAHYLLHFKNIASLSDAYHLAVGLKAIQKNNIGQPIALDLEQSVFPSAPVSTLIVSVRDVLGQNVDSQVTLVSIASSSSRQSSILSNKDMLLTPRGQYKYDVDKLKLGSYFVDFQVQPKDTNYNTISTSRLITVSGSVSVDDFKLTVADNKDSLATSKTTTEAVFGKKFSLVNIAHNKVAKVSFRIVSGSESVTVQQVGIRLSSPSIEVVVPAVVSSDSYSYVIVPRDIGKLLKFHGGNYQLDVIVGDASTTPLVWNAGEVGISFANTTAPIPLSRFAEHQPIDYAFRPLPKPPKAIITSVFTIAVIAPTVVFVLGLFFIGINFNKMPSGMGFLYTVGFIAFIVLNTLLIVKYWLSLTMDVALRYIAVLLIPTVFFGQKSLSSFSDERQKQQLQQQPATPTKKHN